MNTETKAEKSKRLRIAVISGHRKRMKLCSKCGKESHDGDCIENYKKADNRTIIIEGKIIDIQRKKDTIISYRKRKNLCLKCGKEHHNDTECVATYEQVDNRTVEEKNNRPATIITPKYKSVTILQDINSFNNKDIKIQLKKTEDIWLQRSCIVICIQKSLTDNIVEFSCLNYLSKKYKEYIICVTGNIEKEFPYADVLKIKKIHNIIRISNNQQTIINYLWKCKLFISFENDYTDYCKKNKIPVYIFEKGKNATNFLKETIYLK